MARAPFDRAGTVLAGSARCAHPASVIVQETGGAARGAEPGPVEPRRRYTVTGDCRRADGSYDPAALARDVRAELDGVWDNPALADHIADFVAQVAGIPGPAAIGLIVRDEGYVRPVLDVSVLWATPLGEGGPFGDECQDVVGERHAELAAALDPALDTFLDFVDPTVSSRLPDFRSALDGWASRARGGRVILCRALTQSAAQHA
jgi:hypothetical protein